MFSRKGGHMYASSTHNGLFTTSTTPLLLFVINTSHLQYTVCKTEEERSDRNARFRIRDLIQVMCIQKLLTFLSSLTRSGISRKTEKWWWYPNTTFRRCPDSSGYKSLIPRESEVECRVLLQPGTCR